MWAQLYGQSRKSVFANLRVTAKYPSQVIKGTTGSRFHKLDRSSSGLCYLLSIQWFKNSSSAVAQCYDLREDMQKFRTKALTNQKEKVCFCWIILSHKTNSLSLLISITNIWHTGIILTPLLLDFLLLTSRCYGFIFE